MTSTKAQRSSGLRLPITRGFLEKPVPMLPARARRATRAAAAEATSLGAFHADWGLKVGPEADARRGRPSASHARSGRPSPSDGGIADRPPVRQPGRGVVLPPTARRVRRHVGGGLRRPRGRHDGLRRHLRRPQLLSRREAAHPCAVPSCRRAHWPVDLLAAQTDRQQEAPNPERVHDGYPKDRRDIQSPENGDVWAGPASVRCGLFPASAPEPQRLWFRPASPRSHGSDASVAALRASRSI
jgi:hypothetical protein